ncbi:MAG: hypothetical protein N2595_08000 [bacterium]|nr:hypothetical protein [bacterium]
MKHPLRQFLIAVAVSLPLRAATLEWAADGFTFVAQIIADGKGGCAVCGQYTGSFCIVWFDNTGQKVYEKTLSVNTSGIVAFDGKNLIYQVGTSPASLVVVDKNATEQTVSDPNYHMHGSHTAGPYQPNRAFDKKGFFTAQQPTGAGTWRVARYSYK